MYFDNSSGIYSTCASPLRCLLAVGCAASLSLAASGDTITFRDEIYVKGPQVLLGDLADIKGDQAEALAAIEVVTAAIPGKTKRVDASLVIFRMRGAGFDTADWDIQGARRVSATTLHLEITPAMLVEDLRNYLSVKMPWNLDDTIIQITPPGQIFNVPDGSIDIQWKSNPRYRYLGSGAFSGEVLVDGRVVKSFYARADIKTYADVAVVAGSVRRGEPFTALNVRLEKMELSALDTGAFFALDDLKDYVARSTMSPGQLITHRKVVAPRLVRRMQLVTVETRIGALAIRSKARARSDASAGETVECEALDTKERFLGVVRKDGVVVVH
jgi:flagella basal body P-ring formation protein FlgA